MAKRMSQEEQMAKALEAHRQEDAKLQEQILDMLKRIIQFIRGTQRTHASAEQATKNKECVQSLSDEIETYQADALQSGDPERAYLAANFQTALSALISNNGDPKAIRRSEIDAAAHDSFETIQGLLGELEDDPQFEEMFSRYDRHSKSHLESVMKRFTADVVKMVEAKEFGSNHGPKVLMQLANRFNKAAAVRLQAKPLTAAERSGLEVAPEQHPLTRPTSDPTLSPERATGPKAPAPDLEHEMGYRP